MVRRSGLLSQAGVLADKDGKTFSCPVGTYAGVEASTWSHIRSSDGSVGPKHSGRTCTLLPYTLNYTPIAD